MKFRFVAVGGLGAAALMLFGCSFLFPGRIAVKEYDLTVPPLQQPLQAELPQVRIGSIRNNSGSGAFLLHRGAGNRMTHDESSRLYDAVEAILQREFWRNFAAAGTPSSGTGDYLLLSGRLLKFEIDDVKKAAVVEMEVTAERFTADTGKNAVRRILRSETPLKDDSPESAFSALGRGVHRLLSGVPALLKEAASGMDPEEKPNR